MIKRVVSVLALSLMVCGAVVAQTQAEINAAKEMAKQYGYTDAEINNFINHQTGGGGGGGGTTVVVKEAPSTTVSRQESRAVATDEQIIQKAPVTTTSSIFGHQLFSSKYLNFIPSYNIPTPQNYIIAQGDELVIEMWGATVKTITVTVSPEGTINIPDLGPIYIVGETIQSAQNKLKSELSKIYSTLSDEDGSTNMKLSIGKLRSVSVNIVGDVTVPGTYTMPSLSTLFSALYLAGGVNATGTVREIKLYRKGKLVKTLDVYDFILNGAYLDNERMQDNDLIIVSKYNKLVSINGNVKRAQRFELTDGETIADLLEYTGGFTNNAMTEKVHVSRTKGERNRSFVVEESDYNSFILEDGDVVTVTGNSNRFDNRVSINGAVYFPGTYAIASKVSTLRELIESAGGLREEAYREQAYIQRLDDEYQPISVSVNLQDVLSGRNDIALHREDVVRIYNIDDLTPGAIIEVHGAVNKGGNYTYRPGITLRDVILLSNGFSRNATKARIEIARRNENTNSLLPSDTLATVLNVNLVENPMADTMALHPYDIVMVRYAPDYKDQQAVTVTGQVVFPGTHVVETDEVRLSDVIAKAGGFLDKAYVKGAKLTRHLNQEELERLRLATEIAQEKLQASGDTLIIDPARLGTSFDIAIDLQKAVDNPGSDFDVVLRAGDVVSVPKYNNTVKITGGVMMPHVVTYDPKMSWKDYVGTSGGFVKRAMKKKSYFVYMNGTISTKKYGKFKAEPGCELVVPERKAHDRERATLTQSVSIGATVAQLAATILYLFK